MTDATIKVKVAGYTREIESETRLVELVLEGTVQGHHPVYLPRMARWAHAEEIPELYEPLQTALARMREDAARPVWRKLWDRLFRKKR